MLSSQGLRACARPAGARHRPGARRAARVVGHGAHGGEPDVAAGGARARPAGNRDGVERHLGGARRGEEVWRRGAQGARAPPPASSAKGPVLGAWEREPAGCATACCAAHRAARTALRAAPVQAALAPLPERVRPPAGAAAHGRLTAGRAPAQRYEGDADKRHPLRVLFDSAVCSVTEPVRSLLPLASFVWSARTVVLMLQIFLDPKLGFVGTIVEQHMHMTRARALPRPASGAANVPPSAAARQTVLSAPVCVGSEEAWARSVRQVQSAGHDARRRCAPAGLGADGRRGAPRRAPVPPDAAAAAQRGLAPAEPVAAVGHRVHGLVPDQLEGPPGPDLHADPERPPGAR